jgi:UDP-glucose 4-epimerase
VDVNEKGLLHLLNHIRLSPYRPKIIFPSTRLVYQGADNTNQTYA